MDGLDVLEWSINSEKLIIGNITSMEKINLDGEKTMEVQAQAASHDPLGSQVKPVGNQKKKKASWLRTILWMLSMMMLVNVVIGIIAYFVLFYKK